MDIQTQAPPYKKRRLSMQNGTNLSLPLPTLDLSLNDNEKRESSMECNIQKSVCKKRKRTNGPQCCTCNESLNPCDAYIKCANEQCVTKNVIVCIKCFKIGREFAQHKRFHKYFVLRPFGQQFDKETAFESIKRGKNNHLKWTKNDEWNLLDGLRRYGLGNWNGICKIINKKSTVKRNNFDAKHVEAHFYKKYEENVKNKNEIVHCKKQQKKFGLCANGSGKFTEKHKRKCGYKEYRDEFEAEWNNDGEAVIASLYFSEYDTMKERSLKLEGLRLYNEVLDERKVRKKFIKSYGVLYDKKKKRRFADLGDAELESEIGDNLSMFARYTEDKNFNFCEFKNLCIGLMEEKKVRDKIYRLRHYLLNGITSSVQMELIEKYVDRQQELKKTHDDIVCTDEEIIEEDVRSSNEWLNRYNGCSLDDISKYLQLVESENQNKLSSSRRRNKQKNNVNVINDDSESNEDVKKSEKEWNKIKNVKGKDWKKLTEGEKKICDVLRVPANEYKKIEAQIAKRVYEHGLIGKGQMPQQLWVEIDDEYNVDMKIGIVDPQRFAN